MITTSTPPACLPTTILLIEDDCDDQDFITEVLFNINTQLTVCSVPNGNKALQFLETCTTEQLPQLIILDYNLPELNGPNVLQLLMQNRRYHAIPKIVWSTSNAPQFQKRSLELGAVKYMVKPSTMAGIEQMAREMLQQCFVSA